MKLLFYCEPSIEYKTPYFNVCWVLENIKLFNTLSEVNNDIEGVLVCGEHHRSRIKSSFPKKLKLITINNSELYNCFGKSSNITQNYYSFNTKNDHVKYTELLQKKLNSYVPDVIIVYNTPVPFMQTIYPNVLTLHQEVGIFSRPPYPLTYYLDPYGQYDSSYISHFHKELKSLEINGDELKSINRFKDKINSEIFYSKDPFKNNIDLNQPYSHKLLVPFQFSNFADFSNDTGFKSQVDLLIAILSNVDDDIGVVVSQHPNHKVLNNDIIKILQEEFSNFIYNKEFENWYASSQYLLGHVDAVFTTYSSMGLQSLLMDKKLLSLGTSGISKLAHSTNLNEFNTVIRSKAKSRLPAINHLLKYYYIPLDKYSDGKWLYNYIHILKNNSLDFMLSGKITSNIYNEYSNKIIYKNIPSHVPDA